MSVSWLCRQPLQTHCQCHLPGHQFPWLSALRLLAVLASTPLLSHTGGLAPRGLPPQPVPLGWPMGLGGAPVRVTCQKAVRMRPPLVHRPLSTCPPVHTRPPTVTLCHGAALGERKGLPGLPREKQINMGVEGSTSLRLSIPPLTSCPCIFTPYPAMSVCFSKTPPWFSSPPSSMRAAGPPGHRVLAA